LSGILLVRDVMTPSVKTVRVTDSVMEAVRKMNKFKIGSVIVMDGERPVGIVTERDILGRVVEEGIDPNLMEIKNVMSTPLITVEPEVNMEDAARLMSKKRIKKLAVVKEGRLMGVVTTMDLVRHSPELIDLLQEMLRTRQALRS
jgi:CBS domain-containing protein